MYLYVIQHIVNSMQGDLINSETCHAMHLKCFRKIWVATFRVEEKLRDEVRLDGCDLAGLRFSLIVGGERIRGLLDDHEAVSGAFIELRRSRIMRDLWMEVYRLKGHCRMMVDFAAQRKFGAPEEKRVRPRVHHYVKKGEYKYNKKKIS